ncbi:hypothetical protein [Cellulomonas xylanilytica]|uniref:Uncharacterized protein n=1 Tax=Cellulomonas xylanilytica TaxID=233583 RepID=A0A510V869_9CELL|nr:hypothetical protein [Cellulomonas xylanilytica]GEK23057.1 hypothetical protein CXY01_35770 [Cellulomonas xylanilytica]
MSDTPQDPDAGTQEGGYGYPTLEQEVTPEVLEAGAGSDEDGGDESTPGDPVEDPSAAEPTD